MQLIDLLACWPWSNEYMLQTKTRTKKNKNNGNTVYESFMYHSNDNMIFMCVNYFYNRTAKVEYTQRWDEKKIN